MAGNRDDAEESLDAVPRRIQRSPRRAQQNSRTRRPAAWLGTSDRISSGITNTVPERPGVIRTPLLLPSLSLAMQLRVVPCIARRRPSFRCEPRDMVEMLSKNRRRCQLVYSGCTTPLSRRTRGCVGERETLRFQCPEGRNSGYEMASRRRCFPLNDPMLDGSVSDPGAAHTES